MGLISFSFFLFVELLAVICLLLLLALIEIGSLESFRLFVLIGRSSAPCIESFES